MKGYVLAVSHPTAHYIIKHSVTMKILKENTGQGRTPISTFADCIELVEKRKNS